MPKQMLRVNFIQMSTSYENVLSWMPQNTFADNNDSGNGLLPSGNKPLPEPMLTQMHVAILRHQVTMT